MLGDINKAFTEAKASRKNDRFIVESVLDVEEVLPGSEEEFDDAVDVDSVPDDVYRKLDNKLDELIGDGGMDDEEVEELLDDDDDLDDDEYPEIDALISEAANAWVDPEGIGHPDTSRRSSNGIHQPIFDPKSKSMV